MLVARVIAAATGSALAGTGWTPAQWRVDGSRVRGYRAPVTLKPPRNPESIVARVLSGRMG
ncbi:MAG: hypothetical protein B7Z57_09765 [Acidiphilium sp. 37-60-79]|nr:MAG: hypothetical protein B7Z57_09765 [Acidiphilium sp. 37-60-79]